MDTEFFTPKEVREKLKLSRTHLYRLIETGELKAYKFGDKKGYRIAAEDLEKFLESRRSK